MFHPANGVFVSCDLCGDVASAEGNDWPRVYPSKMEARTLLTEVAWDAWEMSCDGQFCPDCRRDRAALMNEREEEMYSHD